MEPLRRAIRLLALCVALGCGAGPERMASPPDAAVLADAAEPEDQAIPMPVAAAVPPDAAASRPDMIVATGPPSPLDGVYTGPSEAYVLVLGGSVRAIQLRYAGNRGLMFVGARVDSEGDWPIRNNAFTVMTSAAVLRGTFPRPGRIDGTWEEAGVRGTWTATRVGDPVTPDAGRADARDTGADRRG